MGYDGRYACILRCCFFHAICNVLIYLLTRYLALILYPLEYRMPFFYIIWHTFYNKLSIFSSSCYFSLYSYAPALAMSFQDGRRKWLYQF